MTKIRIRRGHPLPKVVFVLFVVALCGAVVVNAQSSSGTSSSSSSSSSPCKVCGEDGPDRFPFPDKPLGVENIPVQTCGQLETTTALFRQDSPFCDWVQSVATLCGCPVRENGCTLCWDGSPVTEPTKMLPNYTADDYFSVSLPGVVLSCEILDSTLNYQFNQQDPHCRTVQHNAGQDCGCPTPPASYNNNQSTTVTVSTNETSGRTSNEQTISQCSICPSGEPTPFADKPLNVVNSPYNYTCQDWDGFASAVANDSTDCSLFRSYSLYCGCPRDPNACSLCPLGERVPKPNVVLDWYRATFVSTQTSRFNNQLKTLDPTCEMMESNAANADGARLWAQMDNDIFCMSVQLKSSICGCRPDWRQILLTWGYRSSGILSFLVSPLHSHRLGLSRCLALMPFCSLGIVVHYSGYSQQDY